MTLYYVYTVQCTYLLLYIFEHHLLQTRSKTMKKNPQNSNVTKLGAKLL